MGFESLSAIVRALSPAVIIAWLVFSAGVAFVPSGTTESGRALHGRRVIEPTLLAILFVMGAAVWHQVTGEFIPFGLAWPSAIVMGFAFSLAFIVVVNLQERIPVALSVLLVLVFAIPGSMFFALAFFVLPAMVRWELAFFGP